MKHSFFLTFLLVSALFQPFSVVRAADPNGQPHMRNAIGHLEAAKTAKEPLVSLKAARKELVLARHNKKGERIDALGHVDQAIAFATTGDRKAMLERITKAIGTVKSGIARAP
jgi:hypothetical protein